MKDFLKAIEMMKGMSAEAAFFALLVLVVIVIGIKDRVDLFMALPLIVVVVAAFAAVVLNSTER